LTTKKSLVDAVGGSSGNLKRPESQVKKITNQNNYAHGGVKEPGSFGQKLLEEVENIKVGQTKRGL